MEDSISAEPAIKLLQAKFHSASAGRNAVPLDLPAGHKLSSGKRIERGIW